MPRKFVLQLTKSDGYVMQRPVPLTESALSLYNQQLIDISDNIAELTCVTKLSLTDNALTAIPAGVFAMTQLRALELTENRLVAIPPEIGRLTAMTNLFLGLNALVAVPREIGRLAALERLELHGNALTAVPPELGRLSALRSLYLNGNGLTWLPPALDPTFAADNAPLRELPVAMPACVHTDRRISMQLDGNPLPIVLVEDMLLKVHSRDKLRELFAATTALAMIREPAIVILTALQDLELPALVTLEIIDAAFPNSIRMHAKWELVTAVKHFHQRRGIER